MTLGLTLGIQNIVHIAKYAGQNILLPAFQKQCNSSLKDDNSVVTETDIACQHFLQQELSHLAPEIAFLGEEMSAEEQLACLQSNQPFWCVDPLDGTSNFITPIPLFAISIALIESGKPTIACIYDPIRQECFTAEKDKGFHLNEAISPINPIEQLEHSVGFVDFKRLDAATATRFATQNLYRSQRNLGSCALEWAWLAAGRGQFIVHGREKLWDYAAGLLLAQEAGCKITDFDGKHPFASKQLSSSILAATEPIHSQLLASF